MKEGVDFCIARCGDTLAGIAEKYLGSPRLVQLLMQLNDTQDPPTPGTLLWLHPDGLEPER